MYSVVVPVAAIAGACTHTLPVSVPAFQFSIQNGIAVTPSLAVIRKSLPSLFTFVKSNPLPTTTFT